MGTQRHKILVQYLEKDVESTVRFAAGQNETDVLEWLLHLAVSYLYEDLEDSAEVNGISLANLDLTSCALRVKCAEYKNVIINFEGTFKTAVEYTLIWQIAEWKRECTC